MNQEQYNRRGFHLEISRNKNNKTIEVWLTKAERDDQKLQESLKPHYKKWKEAGYLPVVYLSGNENLYDNTLALLKHNRNRTASQEVAAERAVKTVQMPQQSAFKPERQHKRHGLSI